MKSPNTLPTLALKTATVSLLRQGDAYPCPRKGHPPFVHERSEPILSLEVEGQVVRLIAPKDLRPLRGVIAGRSWEVTEAEVVKVTVWAAKQPAKTPATLTPATKPPRPRSTPTATVRQPKGQYHRARARSHPVSARALLRDCDYLDKLSPQERAWYDQFQRETTLNRWYDKDGVDPFYARGSEARRLVQFEYNRRQDDMMNHKDWWGLDIEARRNDSNGTLGNLLDRMASPAPTEDALIGAIDEKHGK